MRLIDFLQNFGEAVEEEKEHREKAGAKSAGKPKTVKYRPKRHR